MSNLTFKSNGAATVALNKLNSPNETTIQVRKNSGSWLNYSFGSGIALANNDTVEFSGNAKFSKDIQNRYYFSTTGEGTLAVSGDLISLVSSSTIEDDYEFNSLFKDCMNITNATNLNLASNTTKFCYANMFFGCLNLSSAPTFNAVLISEWAYANMFVKCFSLATPPTLPTANAIKDHGYSNMFQNCTSLSSIPNLNTNKHYPWCKNAMFEGCTNINPLRAQPYDKMTGTTSGVYSSMYRKCQNITIAPRYEQTSLQKNSFNFLFDGSKNLNAIEVKFTLWPHNGLEATSCWLNNVALNGTFVCPSALDTGALVRDLYPLQTVPLNWEVLNYLTMPVTFRNMQPYLTSSVKLVKVGSPNTISLKYRKNHSGDWTNYTVGDTIDLGYGLCVSFSGSTSHFSTTVTQYPAAFYRFLTTGAKLELYGNLMSLVNNSSTIVDDALFGLLFAGCNNIAKASDFYLPATSLQNNCYRAMFSGCTVLEEAPKVLPATSLPNHCYREMFMNCTELFVAPEIMGTSLNTSCMDSMFRYCEWLSEITVHFTSWNVSNSSTYAWLEGVAEDGSFYKPSSLAEEYGTNKIPSNWMVYDI